MPELINLNLGCGGDYKQGFINIDCSDAENVDVHADVREYLPNMESGSAGLVYMSHFLEHLPGSDVVAVLKECFRVLVNGGLVEIRVPNFAYYLDKYLDADKGFWEDAKKTKALTHQIIHGRSVEQPIEPIINFFLSAIFLGGYHKFAFTQSSLEYLLKKAGFRFIEFLPLENDNQLVCEAKKDVV